MAKTHPELPNPLTEILASMGEQIKLARLRRKISTTALSQMAGLSRVTLGEIEKGNPRVSLGAYASVLSCLGLEGDLSLIAKEDIPGRNLQDNALLKKEGKRHE